MNLAPGFTCAYIGSIIQHGTLPALSLMLVGIGGWFISMRSLVSNLVTDDHVVYAELAGVSSGKIFSQYVARNALLPQLTGLALSLGHIFGGAVIIEFIFNYPGMGRLLIQGIYRGRLQPRARGDDDLDRGGGGGGLRHRPPLSADRSAREAGLSDDVQGLPRPAALQPSSS